MGVENSLLDIAERDLQISNMIIGTTNDEIMQNMAAYHTQQAIEKIIKHLLNSKRGYASTDHDIERLAVEAKENSIIIPEWVQENSYEISKWATTIRYNSNFKTNRESIQKYNANIIAWIEILRG